MKYISVFLSLFLLFLHQAGSNRKTDIVKVAQLGRGSAETLSWSPDGTTLAVGGSAGVWLFDSDYQQTQYYPTAAVSELEFSPDGEYLAVSYGDNATEFWRVNNFGELIERLSLIPLGGYNLRWSPNGQYALMVDRVLRGQEAPEQSVDVWDPVTGENALSLSVSSLVVDMVWSPDGQFLAGAQSGGVIVIWSFVTGEVVQIIHLSEALVQENLYELSDFTYTTDGDGLYLVFSGSNGLWRWNFATETLIQTDIEVEFADYGLWALERQVDGTLLTVEGGMDGLYVLGENIELQQISFHDSIRDYSWVPKTDRLSILTGNGMVREWDFQSGNLSEHQLFSIPRDVEWSPDGQWILQTTGINPVNFSYPVIAWEIAQADLSSYQSMHVMYPYLSAKWSRWLPDSEQVMVFSDNTAPDALCLVYALEQWGVVENSISHYWDGGLCGLQDVQDLSALNWDYVADWTRDFSLVAVADGDHVSISEQSPYHEPETIIQTENRVTSVAWSPAAAYLLVTSVDQETSQTFVEVWEPLSGNRLILYTLSDALIGTTWSPDQRSIAILSGEDSDYSVLVVDVLNGEIRFHLTQTTRPNLLWKPDGNGLAVSSPTTIEIVSSTSGEASLTINADLVTGIAWHPWRNWLAYSTGHELVIYDVETGKVIVSTSSESNVVSWSPNTELLATLQSDQRIGIWQITESP